VGVTAATIIRCLDSDAIANSGYADCTAVAGHPAMPAGRKETARSLNTILAPGSDSTVEFQRGLGIQRLNRGERKREFECLPPNRLHCYSEVALAVQAAALPQTVTNR